MMILSACSRADDEAANTPPMSDLDHAALEAGLIVAPDMLDLQGAYQTAGNLGTDRFCAIGNRDDGYDIGALAVFGGDSQCEGRGRATLKNEIITLQFTRDSDGAKVRDCEFSAQFDGAIIQFPGQLPQACSAVCSPRASFAGVNFQLVEDGADAARRSKGRALKRLCPQP